MSGRASPKGRVEHRPSRLVRPVLLAGEDLPPSPRQARSITNRRRLKAAALGLFAEKGYDRTSIDEIARRADVAVGGVYLHFRSKRQLLLALMDDLVDVLSNVNLTVAPGSRPRELIRSLVRGAFQRDLQFVGAYRAWQEAVLSEPDLAGRDAAFRRWTQARLVVLFERLQEMPGARRDVDVRTLGRVMDRFFWVLLSDLVGLKRAEARRWLDAAADLTYHAAFTDAASEDLSRKPC